MTLIHNQVLCWQLNFGLMNSNGYANVILLMNNYYAFSAQSVLNDHICQSVCFYLYNYSTDFDKM